MHGTVLRAGFSGVYLDLYMERGLRARPIPCFFTPLVRPLTEYECKLCKKHRASVCRIPLSPPLLPEIHGIPATSLQREGPTDVFLSRGSSSSSACKASIHALFTVTTLDDTHETQKTHDPTHDHDKTIIKNKQETPETHWRYMNQQEPNGFGVLFLFCSFLLSC